MTVLLILSVGSLVASNILDSVEAFRPDLRVIGINSEAEAPNNFRCDRVYLAPSARDGDGYWRRVQQVLALERPDLVMAGREQDLTLMAAWREQHSIWANCLLVGSSSLSMAMTDKLGGHDWAVSRGLRFAPTVAASDPTARHCALAWMDQFDCGLIAKPRVGGGSRGVRVMLDEAALTTVLGDAQVVIQPYLADITPYRALQQQSGLGLPLFWTPTLTQYVAQTVIGPDGRVLGRFDMEATMVGGRYDRTREFNDGALRQAGDHYARHLAQAGWRGPVNVQFVRHPKWGFHAIEFCASATAGLTPRLLLGFDEMALTLSAWTGKTFERRSKPPVSRVALRVTCDVGLDEEATATLCTHGTWPVSCG